jgi:hypothetical protein
MNELTKRVEQWYRGNRKQLTKHFSRTEFTENDSDPLRGAVYMELEGSTLIATITVWNKGDICAEALKTGQNTPVSIEDRVLDEKDEVGTPP